MSNLFGEQLRDHLADIGVIAVIYRKLHMGADKSFTRRALGRF
ncbi:hypothetical protein [Mycobacterium nebraskense]|nr:hypothetical protein [Mycobacterium nebraskense]